MFDAATRLNAALEGRYAIERELGEGGMATVYLAAPIGMTMKGPPALSSSWCRTGLRRCGSECRIKKRGARGRPSNPADKEDPRRGEQLS